MAGLTVCKSCTNSRSDVSCAANMISLHIYPEWISLVDIFSFTFIQDFSAFVHNYINRAIRLKKWKECIKKQRKVGNSNINYRIKSGKLSLTSLTLSSILFYTNTCKCYVFWGMCKKFKNILF